MSSYYRTRLERGLVLPDLTTALTAVEQGFWIFPAAPYDKKPHPGVSSWSEWATCSRRDIRRNWPTDGANIAIAAKPSGLLIIDLDQHEHDGVAAFTRLCEEHESDRDWPDTRTVQTPTGGFHLYFANPSPDRYGNSTGSLPKGIDVRGSGPGEGGYVLAAGSVLDRRAYPGKPQLASLVGGGRAYAVDNDAPILHAPAWLIGYLERTARPPGSGMTGDTDTAGIWFTAKLTDAQLEDHLERTIRRMLAEPEGKRNEMLYWAAKRFGRAVALGRFDYQAACDELQNAGDQADPGPRRDRAEHQERVQEGRRAVSIKDGIRHDEEPANRQDLLRRLQELERDLGTLQVPGAARHQPGRSPGNPASRCSTRKRRRPGCRRSCGLSST